MPTPFVVENIADGRCTRLSGAADYAETLAKCPIRYVLSDALVRLCADLAYSKGARTLECADFLRIPAVHLWVEWAEAPWRAELTRYGIRTCNQSSCIQGGAALGFRVRATAGVGSCARSGPPGRTMRTSG